MEVGAREGRVKRNLEKEGEEKNTSNGRDKPRFIGCDDIKMKQNRTK